MNIPNPNLRSSGLPSTSEGEGKGGFEDGEKITRGLNGKMLAKGNAKWATDVDLPIPIPSLMETLTNMIKWICIYTRSHMLKRYRYT